MSVVAWDGRTLAGDQAVFNGGLRDCFVKVHKITDALGIELLVGFVGSTDQVLPLFEWVRGGRSPADYPPGATGRDTDSEIIVIPADGSAPAKVYWGTHIPFAVEAPYALGEKSARGGALALMLAGNSAPASVRLLIDSNRYDAVGYGVTSFSVETK